MVSCANCPEPSRTPTTFLAGINFRLMFTSKLAVHPLIGALRARDVRVNVAGGRLQVDAPAGALTVLHSFAGGTDGRSPNSSLLVTSGGDFFGTTVTGGLTNNGTIYKIRP